MGHGYTVEERGYETPCWIWNGPVHKAQGYGTYGRHGYAHVAAFVEAFGPVPDGHIVHHRCETKPCVRPDHLEAVTRAAHMVIHRKISDDLAEEIRRAPGSTRQVARRYGISKSHVHHLRSTAA